MEAKPINLIAITPTFGRSLELLGNCLKMFLNQSYPNKYLIIYDDTPHGEYSVNVWDNVALVQLGDRSPSLPGKYKDALIMAETLFEQSMDGIAVWDDDDLYFYNHLEAIAKAAREIQDQPWYSSTPMVFTTYENPVKPQLENAIGRFHGNYAWSRKLFDQLEGYPETDRIDFDQMMMARAQEYGVKAVRMEITYCYRWAGSGAYHCSGIAGDKDWYQKTPQKRQSPILGPIEAKYDDNTQQVINFQRIAEPAWKMEMLADLAPNQN